MTKKELLEKSIINIAKQAGLETSGTFHLTSVSRDFGGLFIMEIMRPHRRRLCDEIKRVVTGFPSDPESGCIALLPKVVDELILAAHSVPMEFMTASGRTGAGETRMDVHRTGDENVTGL